ncbi:glutamine synthetase, partial [Clostridioides difficile]
GCYQTMLDGIKAAAKSGLSTKELEKELSKNVGEESFYLEKDRVGFEESQTMLFDNNRKIAKAYYKNDLGVLKKGAYADVIVVD